METSDTSETIGVIGAGRLARAFLLGLQQRVLISSRTFERAAELARSVDGEAVATSSELAARADVVVLAFEPHAFDQVASEIQPYVAGKVVVSFLARIPLRHLSAKLPGAQVARAMPNVAMQIGRSTTCISTEDEAGTEALEATQRLLQAVGSTYSVPDTQMDVVTWLCGSGPAWSSFFVEAQVDAAVEAGLDPDVAVTIAVESLRAAAASLGADGNADHPIVDATSLSMADVEIAELKATLGAAVGHAFDAALSTPGPRLT